MSKKRMLSILRVLIILTVIITGVTAGYYWQQSLPMMSVLWGMGGAMMVFNFLIAIFFVKKNMK